MSDDKGKRPWSEEIEVAGSKLVERIKEIIKEGNVRRLVLRKPSGDILLEVPMTAGVAVGGLVAMMAPVFAALGALAALVAEFKVEVIRDGADDPGPDQVAGGTGSEDDSSASGSA